ncbi:hypothetical protein, partial [Cognatilysobacter lacus]|uniref:hypothetical protein n=1 Tax=Cognatilysobacter lacus TaxID=1643323 RepID=UPI00195F553D
DGSGSYWIVRRRACRRVYRGNADRAGAPRCYADGAGTFDRDADCAPVGRGFSNALVRQRSPSLGGLHCRSPAAITVAGSVLRG